LVDDNTTSIDVFKIDNNIQKGAIILQKSMDHLNWYNVSVQTNAFKNTPVQNGVLYETTDIEMINGCYYRLVVVYELARKVGTSTVVLVIPKDEIEYKRIAEVYEFYVVDKNEHIEPLVANTKRYSLGETVLVSDFASYSGSKEISKGDLHYGWKLGNFFVSGFTSSVGAKDEVVFLKNAGDVVTLWFNLSQNISALNNDGGLTMNQYTGIETTKKIYVGTNRILAAYAKETVLDWNNTEGTVTLSEGNILRVEYTPIIMTKGGGFTFD